MLSRWSTVLYALLVATILGWVVWREISLHSKHEEASGLTVIKQPVNFVSRTFEPANPPADMPPLHNGEYAECDSQFLSDASVGGETTQLDSTHATVDVTHVKVTLQLNITIWVPAGVTPHVVEHEDGHRQISEFYYQNADKLASRIAAPYVGKLLEINGTDLNADSSRLLIQLAAEINGEYNKELDPEPTQLLYDEITDHGRNGIIAGDAAAHAIKNIGVELPTPGKS